MGIVKVDLLGLGMMAVLEDSLKIIRKDYGEEIDLGHLPANDPLVYEALQKADTVGMFQIESRAQMSCLPRLHPTCFYDIVVQVAIIRPGPIVGQMVNPYLKRRRGREPVECLHPSLEPVLARTLGVPLFQEQLLRMAMIAAGFTGNPGKDRAIDYFVRVIWIPRIPCREFCAAGLCERVPEMPLSRGIYGGHAQ